MKWSTPANWWVEGLVASTMPGPNDDVKLDTTGTPNPGGGTVLWASIVDAGFGGTIKSLSVKAGYTKTITLNKDLIVDFGDPEWPGSTESEIADGTIAGGSILTFRSSAGTPATLTWKGGTIAANTVVGSTTSLVLTDSATKTVDGTGAGKSFVVQGGATWDGQGRLDLKNQGQFNIDPGGTMTISGAATVNGTNQEMFQVYYSGSLVIGVGEAAEVEFKARLNNFNNININQGNLRSNVFRNSGTMTIGSGSEARLGDNSNPIILSSAALTNRSEITGTGKAIFLPGATVRLAGTAKVVNVDDLSLRTETEGAATGSLEISGTYNWKPPTGTGTWEGAGTTTLKASGTLNLGSNLTVARNVVNWGTTNWHSSILPTDAARKITLNGTWDNQGGSVFDIQVLKNFFGGPGPYADAEIAGTGLFNNAGRLHNQTEVSDVIFRPRYQPAVGGVVKEKSTGIPLPIGGLYFPKALRFAQRVTSVGGIFDIESTAGIAFDGGFDKSGGELNSAGGVLVANGFNVAGGTATLAADPDAQLWLYADTVTQTGGTLTVTGYYATVAVTGTYDFAGGTADVNLLNDQDPYTASFGTLVVEAPGLSLSGHINATYDMYVAPGGDVLVYNGAEHTQVTANIIVDGTLRLGITHLIGNLTNNGLLVLGDNSDPGSGVILTGNFTQSGAGIFEVHTASGAANLLEVSGSAQLGGTLHVVPVFGSSGTFAKVMTYGSRQGTFTLSGPPELEMWYDDPFANALGVRVQPDN
jgi:hypothetical protein